MIPRAEYERVLTQRDDLWRRNDGLELELATLRSSSFRHTEPGQLSAPPAKRACVRSESSRDALYTDEYKSNARGVSITGRSPPGFPGCPVIRVPLLRDVMHQVAVMMLSYLDERTQESLRRIVGFDDVSLGAARCRWGLHWLNEPFARILDGVPRDTHHRMGADVHLVILPDDRVPRVVARRTDLVSDGPTTPRVSLWKATPAGLELTYFQWAQSTHATKWSTSHRRRPAVRMDLGALLVSAHLVLRRGWSITPGSLSTAIVTREDLDALVPEHGRASETSSRLSLDVPASWPAQPNLWRYWLTIVTDVSRASQISTLAPLLATMPL